MNNDYNNSDADDVGGGGLLPMMMLAFSLHLLLLVLTGLCRVTTHNSEITTTSFHLTYLPSLTKHQSPKFDRNPLHSNFIRVTSNVTRFLKCAVSGTRWTD